MSEDARLPAPFGAWIDRNRPVTFSFDGQRYGGFAGDTVASALAANGVHLISRSFKYHRPRGPATHAGHDANTLVQLPGNPNAPADVVRVHDGLIAKSQNVRGSVSADRGAWIASFSRFLPVGFYYKAFYRPRGAWNLWAKVFRRMTGLGVIEPSAVPAGYDKRYRHCDVAVVGGGSSGLRAALRYATDGEEVLLFDDQPELGGALNHKRIDADGWAASELRRRLVTAVRASDRIEVVAGATVNGWFADNWLAVIHGKWLDKVRAKHVVLAQGSLDQPAIFRNNDLPGILLGSAVQRLIRLYGVRPGRRAVVLAAGDDGYAVALDLADAGVDVAAVADLRTEPEQTALRRAVRDRQIATHDGHTVYEAVAGRGGRHVGAVELRRVAARGRCESSGQRIDCDLVAVSVGRMPAYQLACMAGATFGYDDETGQFSLTGLPDGVELAAEGAAEANTTWPIVAHPAGNEFVDPDEDLTVADIVNAIRDGYDHAELVKRYSTCGMGPSQGRRSALAMARIVADATGTTVGDIGVTTARPPFGPELLAHAAGRSFLPARRSSMHHRHREAGAQMLIAGDWYRPAYYGAPDARETVILDEARAVRTGVGLIDVSTLGGLEIRGADAAEFMNRVYTTAFKKLAVGRARYALMLNEAGVVIDDGVACRLADDHYYVTATTGGVGRVFLAMLRWNAQWRLDVDLANVTSAWCGVNIAGPSAREVLRRVGTDVDLSAADFPFMGVREGQVAGIEARLIRVGFVGEAGFEIHVPQHAGEALWDALMGAGEPERIRPVGIEAQRLLRLEKGHVIVGQDTDAETTPHELDMGWALAQKKPFYVGGRTLEALGRKPLTRRLAGFVIRGENAPVPQESHLVIDADRMIGRVTSSGWSVALERPIGLAYVPPDRAEPGSAIRIRIDGGALLDADIVALPFYDSENARQAL